MDASYFHPWTDPEEYSIVGMVLLLGRVPWQTSIRDVKYVAQRDHPFRPSTFPPSSHNQSWVTFAMH